MGSCKTESRKSRNGPRGGVSDQGRRGDWTLSRCVRSVAEIRVEFERVTPGLSEGFKPEVCAVSVAPGNQVCVVRAVCFSPIVVGDKGGVSSRYCRPSGMCMTCDHV